jgi:hypothetical protein
MEIVEGRAQFEDGQSVANMLLNEYMARNGQFPRVEEHRLRHKRKILIFNSLYIHEHASFKQRVTCKARNLTCKVSSHLRMLNNNASSYSP